MGKNELLELLKEKAGFETKKEAGEFLDKLDVIVEEISKALKVDESNPKEEVKIKVGKYILVTKKRVYGKTGDINGKPFTSETKDSTKIKSSGQVKGL